MPSLSLVTTPSGPPAGPLSPPKPILVRAPSRWEKKLFPTLGKLNYLLTVRGFLILSFLIYLITGPVAQQGDIIATVVSFSMLTTLLVSSAFTFFVGNSLKRNFSLSVHPPQPESPVVGREAILESGKPILFVIRTAPVSIMPAFELQLQLVFDRPEIAMQRHKLTGANDDQRFIPEQILFPHRGLWSIQHAELSFGDQVGLTRFHWTLPAEALNQSFTVFPPHHETPNVPVISSCHEAGDTVFDVHERRGDPFDLKQYQPSDGIKKIVWKIYAKSGQLVSRHPEPSLTPEGEVAVFCLASRYDDATCADALAYLRMLENLGLSIYFACEGCEHDQIATLPQDAEEMLVEHTWKTEQSSQHSVIGQLDNFVGGLRRELNNARIDSILIFCSSSRLWNKEVLGLYTGVGELLERSRIRPVFCLTESTPARQVGSLTANTLDGRAVQQATGTWQRLSGWFLTGQSAPEVPRADHLPDFLSHCMAKQWTVYQ